MENLADISEHFVYDGEWRNLSYFPSVNCEW